MIVNSEQYVRTLKWIMDFEKVLRDFMEESSKSDINPIFRQAQIDSIQTVIDDLKEQLKTYRFDTEVIISSIGTPIRVSLWEQAPIGISIEGGTTLIDVEDMKKIIAILQRYTGV